MLDLLILAGVILLILINLGVFLLLKKAVTEVTTSIQEYMENLMSSLPLTPSVGEYVSSSGSTETEVEETESAIADTETTEEESK